MSEIDIFETKLDDYADSLHKEQLGIKVIKEILAETRKVKAEIAELRTRVFNLEVLRTLTPVNPLPLNPPSPYPPNLPWYTTSGTLIRKDEEINNDQNKPTTT